LHVAFALRCVCVYVVDCPRSLPFDLLFTFARCCWTHTLIPTRSRLRFVLLIAFTFTLFCVCVYVCCCVLRCVVTLLRCSFCYTLLRLRCCCYVVVVVVVVVTFVVVVVTLLLLLLLFALLLRSLHPVPLLLRCLLRCCLLLLRCCSRLRCCYVTLFVVVVVVTLRCLLLCCCCCCCCCTFTLLHEFVRLSSGSVGCYTLLHVYVCGLPTRFTFGLITHAFGCVCSFTFYFGLPRFNTLHILGYAGLPHRRAPLRTHAHTHCYAHFHTLHHHALPRTRTGCAAARATRAPLPRGLHACCVRYGSRFAHVPPHWFGLLVYVARFALVAAATPHWFVWLVGLVLVYYSHGSTFTPDSHAHRTGSVGSLPGRHTQFPTPHLRF